MATGTRASFAKCRGQKFLWPYTILKGRGTRVVDTSVNKVYVKLDWTKTTIKLNPFLGCFITCASCKEGGLRVLEWVLEAFEGSYLFTPTKLFLLRFTPLIFFSLPRYWKSPFVFPTHFLSFGGFFRAVGGRGGRGGRWTCLLSFAAQHYKSPPTSNF